MYAEDRSELSNGTGTKTPIEAGTATGDDTFAAAGHQALQLSRLELEETLAQEILENPILDVEEPAGTRSNSGNDGTRRAERHRRNEAAAADDCGGDSVTEETRCHPKKKPTTTSMSRLSLPTISATDASKALRWQPRPGPAMSRSRTCVIGGAGLYDHLLWQLHMLDCPPETLSRSAISLSATSTRMASFGRRAEEIIDGTGCDEQGVELP